MGIQKKRFIVLLADGARYDVFRELLDQGRLPHIEEWLLSSGSFIKATSVFPSTTGPAYMPFLTGCFPGTCNVPGIRWFDKKLYHQKRFSFNRYRSYVGFESFLMNHDMHREFKTLFEHFSKSYNVFSSINRGVPTQGNVTSHFRIWYWYYAHLTDHWSMVDQAALDKTLSVLKKDFQFLFTVFPGIDTYSHLSHCRHPQAIEAYRFVDRAVGEIGKTLKRDGKWDETALFIVSDHGLSETREHFGVAEFLEERGLKTFYYPKIFKWGFDVASMVSGNGMLHLYFKGPSGWLSRMPWEEIQEFYPEIISGLLETPAVDLILSQNRAGWVHVRSRAGEVKVKEEGNNLFFSNIRGNPLGLNGAEGFLSKQDALEVTAQSPYPDSILQVTQIFRSARTGDVVLSATKGFDLRKGFEFPEHKSSHGSLHEEHMWTPLFSNLKISRSVVRSADIFPSILHLHGDVIPPGIDGANFF